MKKRKFEMKMRGAGLLFCDEKILVKRHWTCIERRLVFGAFRGGTCCIKTMEGKGRRARAREWLRFIVIYFAKESC